MFACIQAALDEKAAVNLGSPIYDPYRSDPRFHANLRQFGLKESYEVSSPGSG